MVPAPPNRTRADEREFLDLICHDTDLLAVEFDALIAAAWPDPPAQPPSQSSRRDAAGNSSDGGRHSRRTRRAVARLGRSVRPGIDAWSRQRSPPTATTTTD